MDGDVLFKHLIEKAEQAQTGNTPVNLLDELPDRPIWLYGAGHFGKTIYRVLSLQKKAVSGFLDRGATAEDEFDSKPVLPPASERITDEVRKNAQIIICVFCSPADAQQIKTTLAASGFAHILFYYEIPLPFEKMVNDPLKAGNISFFKAHLPEIEQAYACLQDDLSKEIYRNYVDAYISGNLDRFARPDAEPQYFPRNIPFQRGTSRFIDCGAFDGDSVRSLIESRGTSEKLALFEPAKWARQKLAHYVGTAQPAPANEIMIFPCGVWDKSEILAFDQSNEENLYGNSVSQQGDGVVPCVSIDETLFGFHPTFIKMDIEGAEYKALLGAHKTIRANRPDLAICIYHKAADPWELLLLIDSWKLGYQFYIRTYRMFGLETVLYAVCPTE